MNVRKFEVLTMQIAIVVPFVLFVKAVLWTDDVSVLHGVSFEYQGEEYTCLSLLICSKEIT